MSLTELYEQRGTLLGRIGALRAEAITAKGDAAALKRIRTEASALAEDINKLRADIAREEARGRRSAADSYDTTHREEMAMKNANRGEYFAAIGRGAPIPQHVMDALQITIGGNPGNNLLPITVANDLIDDIYEDQAVLAEITHTQIPGLRLPTIEAGTTVSNAWKKGTITDGVVAAGSDATEIELKDGIITFGRHPSRHKISVPTALLEGSAVALDQYITTRLVRAHRDMLCKRIFASTAAADSFKHMGVYNSAVGVTSTEEDTLLDSILAALAELPVDARAVAKVVLSPADWFGLVKTLANGATTLFTKPDEAALGFKVVLCDYATTALVGDLSTIHCNYETQMSVESQKDIDTGMTKFVIASDYDIQILEKGRLRLATVKTGN